MKLQDILLKRRSTRKYLSEDIPDEALRKILSVPDDYRIAGILSLGIPAEKMKEHSPEEADWEKVHWV